MPQVVDPIVRCRDLTIGYEAGDGTTTPVVSGVSFDLAAGEALGIVGESGSGKSTLARALLGYLRGGGRFIGGSLAIEGHEVTTGDRGTLNALRGLRIAMAPQNPLASLTYHIPVGRQVEEVLRTRAGLSRAAARERAAALFAEMGLPDPDRIGRRYPHQLSGGQRQRVVLAAALACDPALIVLDEPTTALDKTTEAQVLDLVKRIRARKGAAIVLVTHDLNVVADICERVIVMKDGGIVEDGPVARVFSAPSSPYTRSLLGAALHLDGDAPAAPPMAPALLQGSGLQFRYESGGWFAGQRTAEPALQDISFTLGRGDVLGVIGESGSGKSTLGHILAGLTAPSAGSLILNGRSIAAVSSQRDAETRRRIQIVFQDPLSSLNPRWTVGASVMRPMQLFFGLSKLEARRRTVALFADLGLPEAYLDRYPRELSGGQQQRVAIARAFAAEPDVLVCDEITSALDASVQAQVIDQLEALRQRRGASLMLITHDLAVIWRLASQVVVLQGGRIVEAGPTAAIFAAPGNAYTRGLLAAATRAAALSQPPQPPERALIHAQ